MSGQNDQLGDEGVAGNGTENPPVSESSGVTADPPSAQEKSPSEQRVPFERFEKVSADNRSLQKKLEKADVEIRKLREQSDIRAALKELQTQQPQDFEDWSDDDQQSYRASRAAKAEVNNQLPGPVQEALRKLVLRQDLEDSGLELSSKQTKAVVEVMDSFDGTIEVEDAHLLAKHRKPDLFTGQTQPESEETEGEDNREERTPRPSVPRATVPTGGTMPDNLATQLEKAKASIGISQDREQNVLSLARVMELNQKIAAKSRRR